MDRLQILLWIAFAVALHSSNVSANSTVGESLFITTDTPPEQTTILPEESTSLTDQEDVLIIDKIFSIEYQIADDKVPKLIADLINTNSFKYNIATQDLINILNLRNITYSNLTKLLDELNIEPRRIDFKKALGAFDLSVIEMLRTLVTNIPDAKSSTPKILTKFGIDPSEYIWITNFENDTSMFNLLSEGNYTEENFAYALGLANMTEDDVLNLLRPSILQHVSLKNIDDFLGFLSQYDLSQRLDLIFEVLNIEADTFYGNPIFSGILSNLTAILNGEDVLAVAVQENELLTVLGMHMKWYTLDSFAVAYALNLQNRSLRYEVENVRNNSLFSVVSIDEVLGGYLRKANYDEYSSENYFGCQCVGKIDGEFSFTDVQGLNLEGDVLVGSTNGTACSLGSPLICSNLLYGLSINAVEGSPKFLTFRSKSVPPTFVYDETIIITVNDPTIGGSTSGGLSVRGLALAVLVLQNLFTLLYVI